MSTPPPDAPPAPSVINWYFGPTAWDTRVDAMWHAGCPDPYATGRDGEVWLDHHRGAFCTGCRHYEPGQAEQDIPAERAAELPPPVKPWEEPSPANPTPEAVAAALAAAQPAPPADQTITEAYPSAPPSEAAATSSAAATDEEAAAAASIPAAALPSPQEAAAAADLTQAPADSHPGILGRIREALGDA